MGWEETIWHLFHVRLMMAHCHVQLCVYLVSEFTRHQVLILGILRMTMCPGFSVKDVDLRQNLVLMGHFSLE